MAIINGYLTLPEFKQYLSIGDTTDDTELELAVEAASRALDDACGQRFWQDPSATVRYFTPQQPHTMLLASAASDLESVGIVSVTSLAVDTTGDGSYATSWAEGTEYYLAPRAADEADRPYTSLRTLHGWSFPAGHETVKVTGIFGWPEVPDVIKKACAIQAAKLFQVSKDGGGGLTDFGNAGGSRYLERSVELLIRPYRLPVVA